MGRLARHALVGGIAYTGATTLPHGRVLGDEIVVQASTRYAVDPRVVSSGNRSVIVWTETDYANVSEVYARSYDQDGNPLGAAVRLSAAGAPALMPDIARNTSADQYLVVWQQWSDTTHFDIKARRISSALGLLGAEITISAQTGPQQLPRVAFNADAGRYGVVWQDGRDLTDWDVYGQLIAADGSLVGGNLGVYRGIYDDTEPDIASQDNASEFMVVLNRVVTPGTPPAITARSLSGTGAIGSTFQVRRHTNERWSPAIAHRAGTDEYLAVWTDQYFFPQRDIYGQRLRSDRTLAGGMLVIGPGAKGQENPSVAFNTQRSEYLAVWQDFRSGVEYDIYARRISATGQLLGQEIVIATEGRLKSHPDVVYSPARDEYFVVWHSIPPTEEGYEIYAQRVSGAGQLVGTAILISRNTNAASEGGARVVYKGHTSEYLVVWYAFTDGSWNIWAQRLSGAGVWVGNNILVSGMTGHDCTWPRMAYGWDQGDFLVVWHDHYDGLVFAQRLNYEGVPISGSRAVSGATTGSLYYDLAYNQATNHYLVIWSQDSPTSAVYAQLLDELVNPVGSRRTLASGGQYDRVALDYDRHSGEFLGIWMHYDTADLYRHRISATGAPVGGRYAISAAPDIQTNPALVQHSWDGDFLVVWQDFRSQSWDIYGQRWVNDALNTATPTATNTATSTPTVTPTATHTATRTATPTPTSTGTRALTRTPSATPTSTETFIPAATPTATSCADAYEPDDVWYAAKLITTDGIVQSHTFHTAGDVDFLKFVAMKDNWYEAWTANLGGGTLNDTVLTLYDSDGTSVLATNDDDPYAPPASRLQWICPETGTYFLKVAQLNPNIGGCAFTYDVGVRVAGQPVLRVYLPVVMRR